MDLAPADRKNGNNALDAAVKAEGMLSTAGRLAYTAEHEQFGDSARKFLAREYLPNMDRVEQEEVADRGFRRASGLLCPTVPKAYSGLGLDFRYNFIGDFGGGGPMQAFGTVTAILSACATGHGQLVDCAMTEGSAILMTMIYSLRAQGVWADEHGVNLLESEGSRRDAGSDTAN